MRQEELQELQELRDDEDAYARHFAFVLRAVAIERSDLRELLSARERALAVAFLSALAPPERRLFARLFQRKGPWFRVASLARYFLWRPYEPPPIAVDGGDGGGFDETTADTADGGDVPIESDDRDALPTAVADAEQPDNAVVQATLRALVAHGFLETLRVGTSANATPSIFAAAQRASAQEEDASLALALEALQQCATAPELAALQKQLTGSKAKKKVPPSASGAAAPWSSKAEAFLAIKKVVTTQRRIDGSRIPLASLAQQAFLESFPLAGKAKSDVLVVRMPDAVRDLFHRMHRLYYFQASLPFSQSAASSASQPSAGCSEHEALARAVAQMHQEATQWPGLMVIFRKVAYPAYEMSHRHHAFPSSEAYVCYEAASHLHYVIVAFEASVQIEAPEDGAEPDLDVKWVAFDSAPQLLAFQKLVETDDDGFELLPNAAAAAEATADATETQACWQMESWRQFRVQLSAMTSLDDLVLETRRCFHAFLLWTRAQTRHGAGASSSNAPVFFSKCNAGYHLARVLHHAAALYEKLRQYQVAVLLLNDLLDSPFLHRKRGHWWERLALNLEHLKCAEQARSTCRNALTDVDVVGADRITISRRLRRLEKRLGGAEEVAAQEPRAPQKQQRRTAEERDQDDFVVSLVSDDDGDSDAGAGAALTHDGPDAETSVLLNEYEYPKEHIVGRPLNRQTAEKSRFIGYDDEPCTVEQLVLQYYRSQRKADGRSSGSEMRGGWYGVHCEGHVIGNIFGLCMWDVLYASVPDVFQTRYQSAPLDFGYADAFYASRRELIDASLRKLEDEWSMEQILDALDTTWRREYGKVSRFVSWPDENYLPLQFHQLVVLAMGQKSLARLMRYMLTSPEYHRAQNGLPDLLMVRAEPTSSETPSALRLDANGCLDIYALCKMTCELNLNGRPEEVAASSGAAADKVTKEEPGKLLDVFKRDEWTLRLKLVEVKGPRDRLSDKQLLWLQVLNEDVGVETSVTHVVEDKKTLEKMRNPTKKKAKASRAAANTAGKKTAKRQKR